MSKNIDLMASLHVAIAKKIKFSSVAGEEATDNTEGTDDFSLVVS